MASLKEGMINDLSNCSPNHTPVTSVDWSPNGCLLVTASINDSNIVIWDVDQNRSTPLRRLGAPCTQVKWSPDGCRLFSATMGSVFRVWNANKWTPERWTVGVGTIQSLTWSPCGSQMVFVTTEEPCLYALHFIEEQVFSSKLLMFFLGGFQLENCLVILLFRHFNAQTSPSGC